MSDELESYIQQQADVGDSREEGVFTITLEKALQKLARFQLPFLGAWLLKAVQAAVAAGADSLEVYTAVDTVEVLFDSPPDWTVAELGVAFYQPEREHPKALQHFLQALWGAMGEGLRFCVELRGRFLEWDGEVRQGRSLSGDRLCLTVRHRGQQAKLGRLLQEHAYTCSIPLRLDRKRLDVMQNNLRCGWSKTGRALLATPVECSMPRFPLPLGSFEETVVGESRILRCSRAVSCFLMVCAHLRETQTQPRWRLGRAPSRCYFVLDGVVVEEVDLPVEARRVSVHLYVSAEGIPTDASSLRLRLPQKSERMLEAARLATAHLRDFKPDLRTFVAGHRPDLSPLGLVLGVGSLILLTVSFWSFISMGALASTLSRQKGDKHERREAASEVQSEWRLLRADLERFISPAQRERPPD